MRASDISPNRTVHPAGDRAGAAVQGQTPQHSPRGGVYRGARAGEANPEGHQRYYPLSM